MGVIGLILAFGFVAMGIALVGLGVDTWALSRRWSK